MIRYLLLQLQPALTFSRMTNRKILRLRFKHRVVSPNRFLPLIMIPVWTVEKTKRSVYEL